MPLELRPLIAFRDYHATTHENGALDARVEIEPGVVDCVALPGLPALYLAHDAAPRSSAPATLVPQLRIRRRARARARFPGRSVQSAAADVRSRARAAPQRDRLAPSAATPATRRGCAIGEMRAARRCGRRAVRTIRWSQRLTLAADQFIVQRGDLQTIIAGYHWFSDWGRDTMIALPGLTLATGRARRRPRDPAGLRRQRRPRHAAQSLSRCRRDARVQHRRRHALVLRSGPRLLARHSGDYAFVRARPLPGLKQTSSTGTCAARATASAWTTMACWPAGEPGVQLTWMDAKVGDWVVTPRTASPSRSRRSGTTRCASWKISPRASAIAARAHATRRTGRRAREQLPRAVLERSGRLPLRRGRRRHARRLHPSQPDLRRQPARTACCDDDDAQARGRGGGARTADARRAAHASRLPTRSIAAATKAAWRAAIRAYHQGTVWPWLMGPFLTAYARLNGGEKPARWLAAMEQHLRSACLGQLFELADGDPPHTPGGCVAQAWSVARTPESEYAT